MKTGVARSDSVKSSCVVSGSNLLGTRGPSVFPCSELMDIGTITVQYIRRAPVDNTLSPLLISELQYTMPSIC